MFHEVSPANAGMQPQQFCLASWNIGGGSEQMGLDLLANIRGRTEFENLQILCLQEVDTKPATQPEHGETSSAEAPEAADPWCHREGQDGQETGIWRRCRGHQPELRGRDSETVESNSHRRRRCHGAGLDL